MSKIRFSAPSAPRPGRAVAGAITTTIASVVPVFLVGGLAVQIGAEFDLSPAGLGLAVSIYFGVSAFASVPAGALVERYGPVTVARLAVLVAVGSLLAIAVAARSLLSLILLLAVGAAANALGQLASNTTLAQYVPTHRQGLSFGVKQAAIPLSTLLAGAAVPTVALTVGWRWAFVVAAGGALLALLLIPGGGGAHQRTARVDGDRATTALIVVALAATLAAGSANALGTFLVDAAVERGVSPGLAGLTLTFGGAICVASRVLGGWIADRRPAGQVAVIAAQLTVGAVGLGLLSLNGSATLVIGVALAFGLGWAWPGLMTFAVVRLHPQAPAAATSLTQTGVYAGACLGPLLLGTVATHAGYGTMWLVGAVAMISAAALMLVGGRMLGRHAGTAS